MSSGPLPSSSGSAANGRRRRRRRLSRARRAPAHAQCGGPRSGRAAGGGGRGPRGGRPGLPASVARAAGRPGSPGCGHTLRPARRAAAGTVRTKRRGPACAPTQGALVTAASCPPCAPNSSTSEFPVSVDESNVETKTAERSPQSKSDGPASLGIFYQTATRSCGPDLQWIFSPQVIKSRKFLHPCPAACVLVDSR